MDNKIDIFLKKYQSMINKQTIKQSPTTEELYQVLCSSEDKNQNLSESVTNTVSYVDKIVKQYIGKLLTSKKAIDVTYINKNKGSYLKYLEISFEKNSFGMGEAIQVVLCVNPIYYNIVTKQIFGYLLNNKISFKSRLSKINRNDNFVISLYSKSEVLNLFQFIHDSNIVNCLKPLNPFIYQVHNIGIVKELQSMSYNSFVSNILHEYIEECILNQQLEPYTSYDLQKFVAIKHENSSNYQDKIMSYNLLNSLHCIIGGHDIFKKINDDYSIYFDRKILNNYQFKVNGSDYEFYFNEKEVNFKTKIYLEAELCLYHMYLVNHNIIMNKFKLNTQIVNKILKDIEDILDDKKINILVNFQSKMIHQLLPYLYGLIALKYKYCNEDECNFIIQFVQKNMISLDRIEGDKYIYNFSNQQIVSSIPIIYNKNNNGLCLIEYIDKESNLVNIKIIKNWEVKSYLNVYINVSTEMIGNNNNYYCRLYRNAISNALLNFDRNKKALDQRKNDFSVSFLTDECEDVNKYSNISIIKKMFSSENKINIL